MVSIGGGNTPTCTMKNAMYCAEYIVPLGRLNCIWTAVSHDFSKAWRTAAWVKTSEKPRWLRAWNTCRELLKTDPLTHYMCLMLVDKVSGFIHLIIIITTVSLWNWSATSCGENLPYTVAGAVLRVKIPPYLRRPYHHLHMLKGNCDSTSVYCRARRQWIFFPDVAICHVRLAFTSTLPSNF
jgi:hypothetical protein